MVGHALRPRRPTCLREKTTAGGLFGAIGYRVAVKIVGGGWAEKFHAHSDRCILTIHGLVVPGSAFACSPCSRSDPFRGRETYSKLHRQVVRDSGLISPAYHGSTELCLKPDVAQRITYIPAALLSHIHSSYNWLFHVATCLRVTTAWSSYQRSTENRLHQYEQCCGLQASEARASI